MKPLILSTHPLHPRAAAMLAEAGELAIASALDNATLIRESASAEIIIVRAPLPPALFETTTRLRAAIRHGAGLDMIPVEAATRAGVLVANVPGANARSVAEHVIMVAMALLRRFRAMDIDLRSGGWLKGRGHADRMHELAGKTVGIVGMGNVGRMVAAIASSGFGLDVIANSRRADSLPAGIGFRDMDALVAEADILVLCCPLTPETRGLINGRRIALMKSSAIVINVARGPVIEDGVLIAALAEGRIAGAALDVFETQPLPADHPYFSFPNVIVTPHLAGITEESMERMGAGAVAEALRVLSGELPVNFINPEVTEHYRRRFSAA